jgi:hypothetical protein
MSERNMRVQAARARLQPSPEAGCSARGCHNCEYGHFGGWKTYRHWPCLTCRVGADLCCGDDNWKPNAEREVRT